MKRLLLIITLLSACAKKNDTTNVTPPPADTTPVVVLPGAGYDLSKINVCTLFAESPVVDTMVHQDYDELSGIAASHTIPGLLYTHEDSGNQPEVYLTNAQGADLGVLVLDGLRNRDWEDIAVGPGPVKGQSYVYVGDIGDNDARYTSVFVYRFLEPDADSLALHTTLHITSIDKIELKYPRGAVNAETLLVDPATADIFIATKENSHSTLYMAPAPQSLTSVTPLTPLANFPFDHLTSGDISPDGNEILLRTTGQIFYWQRQAEDSIVTTLLKAPLKAPYSGNEHQGEAVGFAADGSGYYTTTETKGYAGAAPTISFYKRK